MGQPLAITHSGSLGDIIYSIPAANALDADGYVLTEDSSSGARNMMTLENWLFLKPLIESQGFDCWHWTSPPWNMDTFNMDGYRAKFYKDNKQKLSPVRNIAQLQYLFATGKELKASVDPWLEVPPSENPVIIVSRTPRYQNESFNWKHLVYTFKEFIYFIGEPKDHIAFCREFGQVPMAELSDALDGARLIRGSLGFVGNQSFWLSVAIGLGVNTMIEASHEYPDCGFVRKNMPYWYDPRMLFQWVNACATA